MRFSQIFSGEKRKKLRLIWFVFKWFLIGKYHCNLPKWTCRFWWLCHKTLWAFIAFSVVATLGKILGIS